VSHLLLTINSSLNFLVYTCCTAPFRDRLMSLLQRNSRNSIRAVIINNADNNQEEEEEEEEGIQMVGRNLNFFYLLFL
jgi:hypothetical protein